jgi:hypothetical protein
MSSKYNSQTERLRRERIERNRQMAEEFFNPKAPAVPYEPANRRRDIAGVKVSEAAYQLHSALRGRQALHHLNNAELAAEMNRQRFSRAQLSAEDIEATIAELQAAELLRVGEADSTRPLDIGEQVGERRLDPFTSRYMLSELI